MKFVIKSFQVWFILSLTAGMNVEGGSGELSSPCRVETKGENVIFVHPDFRWELQLANGPEGVLWENLSSGSRVDLNGGEECSLRLSQAKDRIEIYGWKTKITGSRSQTPEAEEGYLAGYHRVEVDDADWKGAGAGFCLPSYPCSDTGPGNSKGRYCWLRTQVHLPADAKSTPVYLGLGGYGIYDWGGCLIFLNGTLLAERTTQKKWVEPGVYRIGPDHECYSALNFGGGNVVAVQAWDYNERPSRLNAVDPFHFRESIETRVLCDQFVTVGEPFQDIHADKKAELTVESEGREAKVRIRLQTDHPEIAADLYYRWSDAEPVLTKWVEVTNRGTSPALLLDVNLGRYPIKAPSTEGGRGLPIYVNGDAFCGIAHPGGVCQGGFGELRLRHFPGCQLKPGEVFVSEKAVFGVGVKGEDSRDAFRAHLLCHSPRHHKVLSILDPFGSVWYPFAQDDQLSVHLPKFAEEEVIVNNVALLDDIRQTHGLRFDYYNIDTGWQDDQDLRHFYRKVWPYGPTRLIRKLESMGLRLGLWFDPTAAGPSQIYRPENPPQWRACTSWGPYNQNDHNPAGVYCIASQPFQDAYEKSFQYHAAAHRMRLVKMDSVRACCWNPDHPHLPGKYSVEAIQNVEIAMYNRLREMAPDIFVMLYFSHDSPWWLLWGDTLFESGLNTEAASPSTTPALYIRDSVTVGLDQNHFYATEYLPLRGKDSLGVWFSEMPWNGMIGPERWIQGWLMDMCRGTGLAQAWCDVSRHLRPEEFELMGKWISLMKKYPDCFMNSRFILGNPWQDGTYGYACSDGQRVFLAVNNATWTDQTIDLLIGESLGLKEGESWNVYRHWPEPAQLQLNGQTTWRRADSLSWWQRPFEVTLLEVAPSKEAACLIGDGSLVEVSATPASGYETRELDVAIKKGSEKNNASMSLEFDLPDGKIAGMLALVVRTREGQTLRKYGNLAEKISLAGTIGNRQIGYGTPGTELAYTTCPAKSGIPQGTSWLVFRIPCESDLRGTAARLTLESNLPDSIALEVSTYLIPGDF